MHHTSKPFIKLSDTPIRQPSPWAKARRPTADNNSRSWSPRSYASRPCTQAAKLTYGSAYRQPIAATDSPQLDSKPHASLGRSRDSDNNNNNNKPNSPAHTDSQAYIAKAQWHDAQATARNSTVYIMLIRHSAQQAQDYSQPEDGSHKYDSKSMSAMHSSNHSYCVQAKTTHVPKIIHSNYRIQTHVMQ